MSEGFCGRLKWESFYWFGVVSFRTRQGSTLPECKGLGKPESNFFGFVHRRGYDGSSGLLFRCSLRYFLTNNLQVGVVSSIH